MYNVSCTTNNAGTTAMLLPGFAHLSVLVQQPATSEQPKTPWPRIQCQHDNGGIQRRTVQHCGVGVCLRAEITASTLRRHDPAWRGRPRCKSICLLKVRRPSLLASATVDDCRPKLAAAASQHHKHHSSRTSRHVYRSIRDSRMKEYKACGYKGRPYQTRSPAYRSSQRQARRQRKRHSRTRQDDTQDPGPRTDPRRSGRGRGRRKW